uniref:Reverse transcriptase domain-containing protein n=1 Tax=Tanacetum cinerariifolium TaxID=118510 RepID=A0A6L2KSU7_TANCI|nr:hypothetical protein [Tanacetum cinerariifolium]
MPKISLVNAITPDFPTKEPEYSLSMGDEHLSTILEMEADEVIKSSVKKLVQIPSESEVTSDNESECDVLINDESSPIFTTFSNPLFDCNDDFTSSGDKSISNEDVLIENFKIYSNSLFDDEEIISTKIAEADFEEEEIHLVENLLYDNSSPLPPKELNAKIADTILESLYPSPIPVEVSDSHMEDIDLFLATDDLMPSAIENDDDSERDIYFLKELLSNDPFPLLENESSNFDHHDDLSFPRPPLKPPNVEVFFDFEPDTGVLTTKVVKDLDFTPSHDSLGFENKIFDPGIFIEVQSERLLSLEEFSISFIRDSLYPVFDTFLPFSSENEEKVFKPGILLMEGTSLSWMSCIFIFIPLGQAQVWRIESGSRLS